MRVIDLVPDQIITRDIIAPARIVNGIAVADPQQDILKIAVVERYSGTGRTGLAFVRGFGLKSGALASSVAHDSHNIIIVGVDDCDMSIALRSIVSAGGGLAVVSKGRLRAVLPLPIGGLMSDEPLDKVCRDLDHLKDTVGRLGCPLKNPFMTLSFMALPVIPKLKITDRGLVDVEKFQFVPLFL